MLILCIWIVASTKLPLCDVEASWRFERLLQYIKIISVLYRNLQTWLCSLVQFKPIWNVEYNQEIANDKKSLLDLSRAAWWRQQYHQTIIFFDFFCVHTLGRCAAGVLTVCWWLSLSFQLVVLDSFNVLCRVMLRDGWSMWCINWEANWDICLQSLFGLQTCLCAWQGFYSYFFYKLASVWEAYRISTSDL